MRHKPADIDRWLDAEVARSHAVKLDLAKRILELPYGDLAGLAIELSDFARQRNYNIDRATDVAALLHRWASTCR